MYFSPGLAAGVADADAGVEAVAAGQEAGLAAHWAATDWGLKIESVSQTRVFVQRTGQASLIQKQTATAETKPIEKTTKNVVEVEEEEEEEVIVRKQPKKINNNSLDQEVSMLSIQQKLKLERQKMLMNTLSPMC